MSDETIHTEALKDARLLLHPQNPDLVIIHLTCHDGTEFGCTVPRDYMPVLIKTWVLDLQAIEAAVERGSPLPGKPFGATDKKPS
jgi:hypothetical protein